MACLYPSDSTPLTSSRARTRLCHSTSSPIDTRAKFSASDGAPIAYPSEYRSIDLAYVVQQVYLFMSDPCEPHLALIKHILCYVEGTLSNGLHIGTSLVESLATYSDADWAIAAPTPDSPHSASASSSATTRCPSPSGARPLSPAPVLKRSTVLLHTSSPSAIGSANSYRRSTSRLLLRPLSIITTSARST
jgi:hypothetical protein